MESRKNSNQELLDLLKELRLNSDSSLSDLRQKQAQWEQEKVSIKVAKILEKQNNKLEQVQIAIRLLENASSFSSQIPVEKPKREQLRPEVVNSRQQFAEKREETLDDKLTKGLAELNVQSSDQLQEILTYQEGLLEEAKEYSPDNFVKEQAQVDKIRELLDIMNKLYPSREQQDRDKLNQLLAQVKLKDVGMIKDQIRSKQLELTRASTTFLSQQLRDRLWTLNEALILAQNLKLISNEVEKQKKADEDSQIFAEQADSSQSAKGKAKQNVPPKPKQEPVVQREEAQEYMKKEDTPGQNDVPKQASIQEEQQKILQALEAQNKQRQYQQFQRALRNFKAVNDMPQCFEKSLIRILYYCALQVSGEQNNLEEQKEDQTKIILEEKALIIKYYAHENIDSPEIKREIDILADVSATCNSGLNQSIEIINRILLKIRQFSFGEFLDLAKNIDKAASKIENNHIVLLLGKTGSGKTTTLQYLCGQHMVLKTINGLNHIEADKISNELQEFKSDPRSQSATRVVRMITVNLRDLDSNSRSEVVNLVDTPGFEDTESAEIDVSNPLAIFKAISKAKSVRPMILLNWNAQGDRMSLWKSQIKFYCKIFRRISDHVRSLNFFFTNVHESYKSQILPKLRDLQDSLNLEDQQDKDFNIVLTELLRKVAQNKAIVIEPLNGQPIRIMDIILNNDAIENPAQAFQISTQNSSNEKVHEQFRIHQKMIEKAMRLNQPKIAQYKINELKEFTEYFNGSTESYSDRLIDSLKSVGKFLSDNFKNAWTNFSKCLQLGNTMNEEDITTYLQCYNYATSFEGVRRHYIKDDVESNDYYLTKVRQLFVEIAEVKMKDVEINSISWQELLNKSQLLKDHIAQFQDMFELAQNCFLKTFEKFFENGRFLISKLQIVEDFNGPLFEDLKDEQEFQQDEDMPVQELKEKKHSMQRLQILDSSRQQEKCAKLFKTLLQTEAKIHIESLKSTISKGIKKMLDYLIEQLKLQTGKCVLKHSFKFDSKSLNVEIIPPNLIIDDDIDQLQSVMQYLYNFKQAFKRLNKESEESVALVYDSSQHTLISMFEYHTHQIKKCLDQKRIEGVEQSLQQLKQLRKISFINKITNQTFYQIQTTINAHVAFLINEVEKVLPDIVNSRMNKDPKLFRNLKEAIQSIKKLGTLINEVSDQSEFKSGFIEQTKQKLNENFYSYIDMIDNEVQEKQISIDKPGDTEIISKAYVIRLELIEVSKLIDLEDIPQTQMVWSTQLDQQFQRIRKDLDKMISNILKDNTIAVEEYKDQEIERKDQEIKKLSFAGQYLSLNDYRRLNCNLSFLDILLQANPSKFCQGMEKTQIRDELKQNIVDLLNGEYERISNSFDDSFNYLLKANRERDESNDKFEDLVQMQTQNIFRILSNLSEISENVQIVFKYIAQQDDSYYEELVDNIDTLYSSLKRDLENSHAEGDQIKWECKIVVLKNAMKLDEFIKSRSVQSFKQLFEQSWLPIIIGNPSAIEASARQQIKELDFIELNSILIKQKESGNPQSKKNISLIKNILNKEIQELTKEIN